VIKSILGYLDALNSL